MNIRDLFVGAVAITLGVIILVGGAGNFNWWYELRKARWIDARFGRRAARILFATIGLALISLGLAIACGFAPNISS